MSVYDPTGSIVSGAAFSVDGLIDQFTDEVSTPITFKNGTTASMSSTTLASLISESVAVEEDEVCLFITTCTVSAATTADVVVGIHYIDSVSQGNDQCYYEPSGSSSGLHGVMVNVSRLIDKSAGTYTFDLQWKNNTGNRAVHSSNQKLYVLRFKRRS